MLQLSSKGHPVINEIFQVVRNMSSSICSLWCFGSNYVISSVLTFIPLPLVENNYQTDLIILQIDQLQMPPKFVALVLTCTVLACLGEVRYDNYQVFRVVPNTKQQVEALEHMRHHIGQMHFWSCPRGLQSPVHVMVPPTVVPYFLKFVDKVGLESKLHIENVQSLIDRTRPPNTLGEFHWNHYHTIEEVNSWMDSLTTYYPSIVSPIVVGTSYEGRELLGVKVSYQSGNPIIFLESGIHAREWITVATATFILNELLNSTDSAVRHVAENFDWYIVPCVNPDGYAYSFKEDRLWRKTRSLQKGGCVGVDANRNWDYYWGDVGASGYPCSETFRGTSPFSESETRGVARFVSQLGDKLQVYLGFHSYEQLLMFPYGLNYEQPDNYDELLEIGSKSAEKLSQRFGTVYTVGRSHDVIYAASGGSLDWVKKKLGVRFTYEYELRDAGHFGFLLPPNQIIPTALETLDSVVVIAQEALKRISNKTVSDSVLK